MPKFGLGMLDGATKRIILKAQLNEITEHCIYKRLAQSSKNENNRIILSRIAEDELRHCNFWKSHTKKDISPDRAKVLGYCLISRLLGITFGIKLMERGEELSQKTYSRLSKSMPEVKYIEKDEAKHERQLIKLIDDERIKYVGSIVLGLNDALVELTGAIAGLTFALQNTKIVGIAAFITGIAASLSMAASEYLSTKSEDGKRNPVKASVYTGTAYILTVLFLTIPYFLLENILSALVFTLINALIIILAFSFYISVVKDISFRKRFLEMALLGFGITILTFAIGYAIRAVFGVDI